MYLGNYICIPSNNVGALQLVNSMKSMEKNEYDELFLFI